MRRHWVAFIGWVLIGIGAVSLAACLAAAALVVALFAAVPR